MKPFDKLTINQGYIVELNNKEKYFVFNDKIIMNSDNSINLDNYDENLIYNDTDINHSFSISKIYKYSDDNLPRSFKSLFDENNLILVSDRNSCAELSYAYISNKLFLNKKCYATENYGWCYEWNPKNNTDCQYRNIVKDRTQHHRLLLFNMMINIQTYFNEKFNDNKKYYYISYDKETDKFIKKVSSHKDIDMFVFYDEIALDSVFSILTEKDLKILYNIT